jgi:redox-sensitive bicupin YhaK (pirin superfamily)
MIAGACGGARGAARTFSPVNLWDLRLNAHRSLSLDVPDGHTAALFVLKGSIRIGTQPVGAAELAVMERDGTVLALETLADSVVLLLGGEPLHEPIVGHGPFVMNTREEIAQAMKDFGSGKFGAIEGPLLTSLLRADGAPGPRWADGLRRLYSTSH